jgi:hypothetical protein
MYREIGVPLPISYLRVVETAVRRGSIFVGAGFPQRQRAERLREKDHLQSPDRDLAGLGTEQDAFHADVIAEVQQLHQIVGLSQQIQPEVELDSARAVFDVAK